MDASVVSASDPAAEPQPGSERGRVVCRRIVADDIVEVADLLATGFPERSTAYWLRGLERMAGRPVPDPYPRFGFALADHGRIVGVILLIVTKCEDDTTIKGNVSSWYVEPAYRGFSNLLLTVPLRMKTVTWFNISPAPHTLATIEAQGFSRYASGSLYVLAALSPPVRGAVVRAVVGMEHDVRLLERHAACGCLCFEVHHTGHVARFAFRRTRALKNHLPSAQLIYCDDLADFVRFAGPLGRRLLRHGLVSVLVDANGPIPGLIARHAPGRGLRYFRGTKAPRLGDLSDSELVIFGD